MVRTPIKVVLRTRPVTQEPESVQFDTENKTINISTPVKHGRHDGRADHQFKFDALLRNATQEAVFEEVAGPLLQGLLAGCNGTIMAYGQTGAGKTHTMTGSRMRFQDRGLVPRILSRIFQALPRAAPRGAAVHVSYMEIYNEAIYDLLGCAAAPPADLAVQEDPGSGAVCVRGLRRCRVHTEGEALSLLLEGEDSRAVGQHRLNRESSRSHTVFTVHLEQPGSAQLGAARAAKLHLVDLAGSERVGKTGSEGATLKEASHINRSLSHLERVVVALADSQRDHIPYRSSKLTHALKDSVGGNCHTLLIANVWPEPEHLGETLSTCRFAQRVSAVRNDVIINLLQDAPALIQRYERELRELRQELAMHDALAGRTGASYAQYNAAQRETLQQQVLQFLCGPDEGLDDASIRPLQLHSLRHMKEILFACRRLFQQHRGSSGGSLPSDAAPQAPPLASDPPGPSHSRRHTAGQESGRGSGGSSAASSQAPASGRVPVPAADAVPSASCRAAFGSGLEAYDEATAVGEVEDDDGCVGGVGVAPDAACPGAAAPQLGPGGLGSRGKPAEAEHAGPLQPLRLPAVEQKGVALGPVSERSSGDATGAELAPDAAAGTPGSEWADSSARQLTGRQPSTTSSVASEVCVPDRKAIFQDYKAGPGQTKAAVLADNKAQLREVKRRLRELVSSLNAAKRTLDGLQEQAGQFRRDAGVDVAEQVMEAGEYAILVRVREVKQRYREEHAELQMVQSEAQHLQQLIQQGTQELVLEFDDWYSSAFPCVAQPSPPALLPLPSSSSSSNPMLQKLPRSRSADAAPSSSIAEAAAAGPGVGSPLAAMLMREGAAAMHASEVAFQTAQAAAKRRTKLPAVPRPHRKTAVRSEGPSFGSSIRTATPIQT